VLVSGIRGQQRVAWASVRECHQSASTYEDGLHAGAPLPPELGGAYRKELIGRNTTAPRS
jgi:hypothetical protein